MTLVNGTATVADDFSGLDGRNLTFADLGTLPLQAAYDGGSKKTTFTVDTSSIQRQQEEQQYTAAEVECKTKMTTTYTGSKLTYTGTEYDETGKVGTIHEIRDDYYTRNHRCITFRLTIPAAESTAIDSVQVTDATLTYQAGDKPQATAKADANARIAYEYWEEMEQNGKGELVPVKFWYSDPAKLAKVPEEERITQFEAGKRYMYSLMLASAEGDTFAADCALTLNGEAVNSRNVNVGRDGKTLFPRPEDLEAERLREAGDAGVPHHRRCQRRLDQGQRDRPDLPRQRPLREVHRPPGGRQDLGQRRLHRLFWLHRGHPGAYLPGDPDGRQAPPDRPLHRRPVRHQLHRPGGRGRPGRMIPLMTPTTTPPRRLSRSLPRRATRRPKPRPRRPAPPRLVTAPTLPCGRCC